jgi:hypothetical protein
MGKNAGVNMQNPSLVVAHQKPDNDHDVGNASRHKPTKYFMCVLLAER